MCIKGCRVIVYLYFIFFLNGSISFSERPELISEQESRIDTSLFHLPCKPKYFHVKNVSLEYNKKHEKYKFGMFFIRLVLCNCNLDITLWTLKCSHCQCKEILSYIYKKVFIPYSFFIM